MNLSRWVTKEMRLLLEFEYYWRANNEKSPDSHPPEMDDWELQFYLMMTARTIRSIYNRIIL